MNIASTFSRIALGWACALALLPPAALVAQTPANVLVVANENSAVSKSIAEYYVRRRAIPLKNLCRIRTAESEEIRWEVYKAEVEAPVARCLRDNGLAEQVLYIVTTLGVPLKIESAGGEGGDQAAVDSELTLLYQTMRGLPHRLAGVIPNPMFGKPDQPFRHPGVPIYMVTRLAGYDFQDVRAMIDRSLQAANRGIFVFDLKSWDIGPGDDWLWRAARLLPKERVLLDESSDVILGAKNVIGYASWGSNDPHRKQRHLNFEWLPGAIASEFVSSDGRTFTRPPESWIPGRFEGKDHSNWWAGTPQSLTADLIHEGATGASGHVYEPFLSGTPRPEYLFPAYYSGRNLAESYYVAIPFLSWMNIVVGDPLCSLGRPPEPPTDGRRPNAPRR